MSESMRLVEVVIGIVAIVAIAGTFVLPHRIRPHEFAANPEAREAFRGNLIHALTVVLVVIGAAVALEQLAASMDQLQEDRLSQVADEVEAATTRLNDPNNDQQARVDAIADLARLHSMSSEHQFPIERDLLRFVQRRARLTDNSYASPQAEPPEDLSRALNFLVTKGQEHLEPDWAAMGEGSSLA